MDEVARKYFLCQKDDDDRFKERESGGKNETKIKHLPNPIAMPFNDDKIND